MKPGHVTPEQHAEVVQLARDIAYGVGDDRDGWYGAAEAKTLAIALARLAADTERLRKTWRLAPIVLSVLADHDDACDHAMNDEYACSCGHDLLVAAFGAALASPPADTEQPTCDEDVWDGPYKMRCGRLLDRDGRCSRHFLASPPADTEQEEPVPRDEHGNEATGVCMNCGNPMPENPNQPWCPKCVDDPEQQS